MSKPLYGSLWDRMPVWLRIVAVIAATLYFGGGLIAPFFWHIQQ